MNLIMSFTDGTEAVLPLVDNEWQFFVHMGNREDMDNRLIISNTLYDIMNSGDIRKFFKTYRNTPHETISNIQLYSNDEILLFDATELGFQYKDMFIEFKYNSNMVEMSTQDRGLIYEFRFINKAEAAEEVAETEK